MMQFIRDRALMFVIVYQSSRFIGESASGNDKTDFIRNGDL